MSEFIYDWTPNKQHQKEEIVRCRDCRYCVDRGTRHYCDLNAGGFPEVEQNGFCAWGERK